MAVIRYTHGFDLLHKIGNVVGGIAVLGAASSIVSPIGDQIELLLKKLGLEWVWLIIILAYAIFGYVGAIILINKTIWPSWLPTYLYVRLWLITPIKIEEARKLDYLFDGSLNGQWYPLRAIRKIESEYRKEALFRFANKVADDYGWAHPFEMPEDRARKQYRQQSEREQDKSRGDQQKYTSTGISSEVECSLKILGLDSLPSNFDLIRQAYRKKIKQFHPDKFAGEKPEVLKYAEETSKRINGAYGFLEKLFFRSGNQ